MISVEELAALIGQRVKLRRIGPKRWAGLCPLPGHREKTPSFQIFEGHDGEGRYYCHGCHRGGTARWWKRSILGQAIVVEKPDPAVELDREKRRFEEIEWQALRDLDPNLEEAARPFIDLDLRESVRRRLGGV